VTVEVVVPWRAGCPHRETALAWLLDRLGPVTLAEAPDGPWCKAQTIMPAIRASTADIVVVHDADVWCDAIPDAVAAVEAGALWAVPHLHVNRLTEPATAAYLAGADPATLTLEQERYVGVLSGGIVVVRRHVAVDTPMDATFQGWGGEDHSWGYALSTLHGNPWRGHADLWHLWHPPADRLNRRIGSYPSEQRRRRYFAAMNDRPAMRALVEEGRDPTWRTPASTSTTPASAKS
jgi:hypothetical protein